MSDEKNDQPADKSIWYGMLYQRVSGGMVIEYTSSLGVICNGRIEDVSKGVHPDLVQICRFTLVNDTKEEHPIEALKERLQAEARKLGISYVVGLDPNPKLPYNYEHGRHMERRAKMLRQNPKPWTILRI